MCNCTMTRCWLRYLRCSCSCHRTGYLSWLAPSAEPTTEGDKT